MRAATGRRSYRWALVPIGMVGVASLAIALSATGAGNKPKCFGKEATKVGNGNPNTINGTPQNDVIVSLGGGDSVDGKAGNDRICTDGGADGAAGGAGDDKINGGPKADSLDGDTGIDNQPGDGEDLIKGTRGADRLEGQGADDKILGGDNNDILDGQSGKADFCDGGPRGDNVTNCETGPGD